MKRAGIIGLLLLLLAHSAAAQTEERLRYWLTLVVDSAYVRALPTREGEVVASRFEGDRLEAVGRNADGTWFQVTAPYNANVLGWISGSTVTYEFEITLLPITDLVTGVTGPTPVVDSGISVFINQNARLRRDAGREAPVIAILPNGVTLPVVARNTAGDWLLVNYNGTLGWVAAFLTRTVNDVAAVPVFISPRATAAVTVIPPEVQLGQIERLRAYLAAPITAAAALSSRIFAVTTRQIVPCTNIADVFAPYSYTAQDVRQLPELGRFGPSINDAIADLNTAITMIGACGVYTQAQLAEATALLPGPFFATLTRTLDNLEATIRALG